MPLLSNILPLAQAQAGGTRELIDTLARTPLSKVVIFVVILSIIRVIFTRSCGEPLPTSEPVGTL